MCSQLKRFDTAVEGKIGIYQFYETACIWLFVCDAVVCVYDSLLSVSQGLVLHFS